MKQFEPIVIQEQTRTKWLISVNYSKVGRTPVVSVRYQWKGTPHKCFALSKQAAIRLRDALNTILND